VAERQTR